MTFLFWKSESIHPPKEQDLGDQPQTEDIASID